jgi:hypothetical protein
MGVFMAVVLHLASHRLDTDQHHAQERNLVNTLVRPLC